MQITAKNLPRLDEDERLGPVIDHLAASFLSGIGASDYQPSGEHADGTVVTAEMIDDVAKRHFPPCMRHLYERTKRDQHMKHFGRLQLTLFLKVSLKHLKGGRGLMTGTGSAARRSDHILAEDVRLEHV